MPLKANVSLSKKLGLPDYGSIGAHCGLELELDSTLIEDAEAFHEKIRKLYTLCHQSIVDQLERYGGNGNGTANSNGRANGNHNGRSNGTSQHAEPAGNHPNPPAAVNRTGNGNGRNGNGDDTPASNKQVKYLLDLARQQHNMNMTQTGEYCQQLTGVGDVYRLTKTQASLVIDHLSGGKSNGHGNGRTRVSGRR
mgnify:FL=1|jgi:hypothetical protein